MKNKKEVVYVVGDYGPEHNNIVSIHKSYEGALKSWEQLRRELTQKAKYYLKNPDKFSKKMFSEIVKNLSCKDPKLIDNYPHETPYIYEKELKP